YCKFEFTNNPEESQVEHVIQDQYSEKEEADEQSIMTMSGESTVYSPPVFILPLPEEETVVENQGHVFRCTFHGIPLPTATWFIDDLQINQGENYHIIDED